MATTNDSKTLRFKRKNSALKKVWDYMRRNRTFRVGDIIAITGVSHNYLKTILWHLRKADYIEMLEKVKPYSNTQYVLKKATGAKSPSLSNGVLYDYNTNEEIVVKPPVAFNKDSNIKLLSVMREEEMTKEEMMHLADVREHTARKLWKKFSDRDVMSNIKPCKRKDGQKLFKIDINKAKELQEKLESGETL